MQIFNNLLTLFDPSKWFARVGSEINELVTRNGHLISEDINFIESIISSQNDFQLNNYNNNYFNLKSIYYNNRLKLVTICSSTIGIIWYLYEDISYHLVIPTIIYSILLTCLPITFDLIRKIYFKYRLLNKTITLSDKIESQRNLLKKYFKLLEDNEVIEKSERHSTRVREMKQSFRTICWKCFVRIRQSTIQLRESFPLKAEVDDQMNFLCCLPIESFDNFVTEDQSVISINLLKSLMRLTRLQQSEFFRRLICLFMTICSENKYNQSDDYIKNIYKEVSKMFDVLIEETNETFSDLYSAYSCGKSLWVSSQMPVINNSHCERHQTSETFNLLNLNRSIRKHLLTSLTIVDDCDAMIEDGIEIASSRFQVTQKLDSLNNELKALNDLVLSIEKLLKLGELKESKITQSSSPNINTEEDTRPPITTSNIDNYIVTDQVFEAYISSECDQNELSCDTDDDQLWEYRLKLAQEAEASSNLYHELKVALKSKAVEHKIREAKALGIEIDEMSSEQNDQFDQQNIDLRNENQSHHTLNDEKVVRFVANFSQLKDSNETNLEVMKDPLISNNMFGLTSQIANIAAERGKMLGLSAQSECFGDEIEECEDNCDNYSD